MVGKKTLREAIRDLKSLAPTIAGIQDEHAKVAINKIQQVLLKLLEKDVKVS